MCGLTPAVDLECVIHPIRASDPCWPHFPAEVHPLDPHLAGDHASSARLISKGHWFGHFHHPKLNDCPLGLLVDRFRHSGHPLDRLQHHRLAWMN